MTWWQNYIAVYVAGVITAFIVSAKHKRWIEKELCSWKTFTFLWPVVACSFLLFVLRNTPNDIVIVMNRWHNRFFRWLNAPKTKPLPDYEEEAPFVGGYRKAAGIKCPACQRNV